MEQVNNLYELTKEGILINRRKDYEKEVINLLTASNSDPRLRELLDERAKIIRLVEDGKKWEYTPYGFIKRIVTGHDDKQIAYKTEIIRRKNAEYSVDETADAFTKIHYVECKKELETLSSIERGIYEKYIDNVYFAAKLARLKDEKPAYKNLPQDYDELRNKKLKGEDNIRANEEVYNIESLIKYNGERIVIIVYLWLKKIDRFSSYEEMLREFLKEFEVYINAREQLENERIFELPETDREKHYYDTAHFPMIFLNILSKYSARGELLKYLYEYQMEHPKEEIQSNKMTV